MCVWFCLYISPNIFSILLSFPLWPGNYFVGELKLKNLNPYPLSLFCSLSFQTGLFFTDVLLHFHIFRSRLLFGVGSSEELSCSVSCRRRREFRAHYSSKAGWCLLLPPSSCASTISNRTQPRGSQSPGMWCCSGIRAPSVGCLALKQWRKKKMSLGFVRQRQFLYF